MKDFNQIDHILYGGSDLEEGIRQLNQKAGIRPVTGGSHPGKGTRNALLGLSHGAYLEVIGPDPAQSVDRVWMDLDQAENASLFRWAAKCDNLYELRSRALEAGIDIGEIQHGSRQQSDGSLLEWQLTDPNVVLCDGLVPFFIDWGHKGNPSRELPGAGNIRSFHAVHPSPDKVKSVLKILSMEMDVQLGNKPGLHIEIESDHGTFQLN